MTTDVFPAFNAIQCVNADHRRKHPAYAVLAASLAVEGADE